MEVECTYCDEVCDSYDEDKHLDKVIIYFECDKCGNMFERIYNYFRTENKGDMR